MVVQQQNLAVIPCGFRQELNSNLHALTSIKSSYRWLYGKWAVGNIYIIYKCNKVIKTDQNMELSVQHNVQKSALTCLSYLHVLSWNLASQFPMFRTSRVLWDKHLTGQTWKCRLSGKSKMARGPIARIGTSNFSRSVTQMSLWM